MKKRFLPFSLLLVTMILGQSVMADGGHYVPRAKETSSAEAFLSSMRVNQHTGLIDPAWMIAASKQHASQTNRDLPEALYWISMGPDNVGGKTTAVIYDNQDVNKVYIGSMGGGLFLSISNGETWQQVSDNLMVRCMAQAEDGTIYIGTGDGFNAVDNNMFSDLEYDNSFIGSGLYTFKNNVLTLVEGTAPSQNGGSQWSFINDIATYGNNVIVATCDGLRVKDGDAWSYAKSNNVNLTGNAVEVKVASDNTIVASVDGKFYIGTADNMVCCTGETDEVIVEDVITKIAPAAEDGFLDVAVAPSDPNVVYAAVINNAGSHVKIYCSHDKGATWTVALNTPDTDYHDVYGGRGLYNHGMVVDPFNPYCIFVLGMDVWRLDGTSQNGYYVAVKISSTSRIHGINDLKFDPRESVANKGYVATDGGIFTMTISNDPHSPILSPLNSNRGYISSRCMNVTLSGNTNRIIGGILDHGPVIIKGLENVNSMTSGELLMPYALPVYNGGYSASYNSGSSVISAICPNTFVVTTKDGGIQRTETAAEDWDATNFTGEDVLDVSFKGYRMPIALFETFEDANSVAEVMFKCTKDQAKGDIVQCFSQNGGYPFDYVLPHAMHYNPEHPNLSDSLMVKDPITTKFFIPTISDDICDIYMTFDVLKFSKVAEWYKIGTLEGNYPTCMTVSADGDVLFVGTKEGKLYGFSNLKEVVDDNTIDAVNTFNVELSTQCITSVAVYNEDNNKVVVTLGNYGNDAYVMYSNNVLSDDPVFVSKQGALPKMPVYASVYTVYREKDEEGNVVSVAEHVLLGTEHGVYRTTNIAANNPTWVAENTLIGDVPVLDMRQQNMTHPDQKVVTIIDGVEEITTYPGVNNQGMVYAATYGRGLFRCENYRKQYSGQGVAENTVAAAQGKVDMYPNPVRDAAKVSFELNENASVSYQVFDLSGRVVKAESLGNYGQGKHEANISVNGLAKGAYVLRLTAGRQASSVKFMVF